MPSALELPPEVSRKVDALGDAGHRWLDSLPATIDDLAAAWDLTVHEVLTGGGAALVVSATMDDGRPAVLKLAMPDGLEGNGDLSREVAAVRAGQGHGYVGLRRVDLERRVALLERLGRAIVELELGDDVGQDFLTVADALLGG